MPLMMLEFKLAVTTTLLSSTSMSIADALFDDDDDDDCLHAGQLRLLALVVSLLGSCNAASIITGVKKNKCCKIPQD